MRFVTFHPVGHHPADAIVLAGLLDAVWSAHEVPLLLDRQADGSITIDQAPAAGEGCDIDPNPIPADVTPEPEPEPEPEPARLAARSKPAPAKPAAQRTKLSDDDIVAAVRDHGPISGTALCRVLDYSSSGSMHTRLTKLAHAGRVEKAGTTWRIPTTATAPASNGTATASAPAKPGSGVAVGPVERRPFDPEAARIRAAGEL